MQDVNVGTEEERPVLVGGHPSSQMLEKSEEDPAKETEKEQSVGSQENRAR